MRVGLTFVFLALFAGLATAAWRIDPQQSELAFVSVQGGTAENHRFRRFAGGIDAAGGLHVHIDLASVDTALAGRDQRLRELLFEVEQHPQAVIQARIDPETLAALRRGQPQRQELLLNLSLHGEQRPLRGEFVLVRLAADTLLVSLNLLLRRVR